MSGRPRLSIVVSAFICAFALVPYALLLDVMQEGTVLAIGLFGGLLLGYLVWSYYVIEHRPTYTGVFSLKGLGAVMVGVTALVMGMGWVPRTALALVHLLALVLLFSYWLVLLVAVYHEATGRDEFEPSPPYESLTVLVPAYNEEGYIGRTIESLLRAEYPDAKKQVFVIDDGSTDGTYQEAKEYESDVVSVFRKDNGGKYSALNYGLMFAESEYVVTIDADSIVAKDALKRIVAPFDADPDIGAVASNVKIINRTNLVTRCQSLEYIFGINIYRRVFDHFGIVPIVPGCLGGFRRDVLEEVSAYDPETLTEDFDATMKVLLAGYEVRVSDALVYTEAPDTWKDLYNQRLRWYRGNYMTVFKHLGRLSDPGTGYLHRLFLFLRVIEMFFLPVAGWVILGVITYLLLVESAIQLLVLFVFFTSIVVVINALAIQIEQEDLRHIAYAPLFVIGYKHFHDLVMLKSLVDVLGDREMGWTSASRVRQRPANTAVEPEDD